MVWLCTDNYKQLVRINLRTFHDTNPYSLLFFYPYSSLFYINFMQKPNIIVIANRIRSLYNVGSIFRTCDAIGAEKLYLAGYTASPKEQPIRLNKTALGAEETVAWEKIKTLAPTIKKLKTEGYEIIAVEEVRGKSLDYRQWKPKNKVALILGNEVTGLTPAILKQCDKIISLPMNGKKKSLNVSVAFGSIAYYILSNLKTKKAD